LDVVFSLRLLIRVAVAVLAMVAALQLPLHASAQQEGNLTDQIRALIASVASNGLNESLVADALTNLTKCYPGAIAEAAEAARAALGDPELLAQRLRQLAALAVEAAGQKPLCPRPVAAHSLYVAVLASFYTPTGLGVMLPPGDGVAAPLPPSLGGAVCGPRGYAAVLAAAASRWLSDDIAIQVLNETGGAVCLVLAAAHAGPPPVASPAGGTAVSPKTAVETIEAYYLSHGRVPPASPAWVFEDAVKLLQQGRRAEAAGLLHLIEAAYPGYSVALSVAASSDDPLLYYAQKRAQGMPRLELPIDNPYCLAEKLLAESLASHEAGPETGVAEMLGVSASFCYAATGRGVAEMLKVNPLAPLDPVAIGIGPPGGPSRLLVEQSTTLPRSLLVPVTAEEAAIVLARSKLNERSIEAIVRDAVALEPLLKLLARHRGDPQVLGYIARAAGLRAINNNLYIDYAVARLVAWALVREGKIHFPNLVINDLQSPIEPYYVIFTVPGQQRIILWALGWITTVTPPSSAPGGGAAGEEKQRTNETVAGSEAAANTAETGQASIAPSVEKLEELADTLASLPGGQAYAEILHEAADALRAGDYARAAEAARKLRKVLENLVGKEAARRLIEEAAKSLGMSPEQLAKLLAEAASLKPTGNGVTVDLKEATILSEKLAAGKTAGAAGGGPEAATRLIEAAAGVVAESTKLALQEGQGLQPLRIEGLSWLLNNTGTNSLFANITGLIARTVGGSMQVPEGGAEAASASSPATLLPSPPPAPSLEPPGWVRLAAAAAVAVLAVAAAARTGLLKRTVESIRLAMVERRLAKAEAGAVGGHLDVEAAEAFAAILEAMSRAYRPRRPSETHREYGRSLGGGAAARLYWAAASAYEKLRFGHGGASELEALRRALREARRLLAARRAGRR